MQPEFIAKKSAWEAVSFLWILLCFLFFPLIFVVVFRIFAVKEYRLEFYAEKIIIRRGLINKRTDEMVFMGITSLSLEQGLGGQLFNYGTIKVDCVGKWDVNNTTYIKNPKELEAYLRTRIIKAQPTATIQPVTTFLHM